MNSSRPTAAATTLPDSEFESSSTPVIECHGLKKRFGRHDVLNGVDLVIPRGAVVGLVGTNGAGKSTLIKCLLGLLRPTDGKATVWNEDPWFLSTAAKANLGYVPQTVQLIPWMRVNQLIEHTAAFYERWDDAWVKTLVERLEIPQDRQVGPLSPGQHQKLALVLALGHRPDLLILDEPVASLDPIARRELLRSLMEMSLDNRHTVLFSTHITSDLERVATHIALLQKGKIALFEELDAVKDRVKRLRISARRALPSSLSIRGMIQARVDGDQAIVTVTDLNERLLEELRSTYAAEVAVEDLNLEDIFVELHHS